MSPLRGRLIAVLAVAAVAEVLLLRIALRLGPVLPNQADVLPLFALVEWLGVVALNVGVLAGAVVIGMTALEAAKLDQRGGARISRADLPLAFALVAAVLVNLGLPRLLGVGPDGLAALVHGGVTGAAIVLTVLGSTQPPRVRFALGLVGLAQVLALAQATTRSLDLFAGAGPGPLVLAEIVAVVAALALPWLLKVRPRRGELALGAVAGLLVAIGGTLQPWGLATVAIWTMGFSFFLPPILYGAALASVLATGLALWHRPRRPGGGELATGLLLIWLAGLKLDVSSMALMAVAGLVVAARPRHTMSNTMTNDATPSEAAPRDVEGSAPWASQRPVAGVGSPTP
jgi:hypothetical protein